MIKNVINKSVNEYIFIMIAAIVIYIALNTANDKYSKKEGMINIPYSKPKWNRNTCNKLINKGLRT